MYNQFKQTDIGPIPIDWEIKRLDESAQVIMGQSPPSSTYNEVGEGLPFYQGKTDFGSIYPSARVWCSSPTKIAEKNDILISVRAPVGPTNLSKEKCSIGRGLSIIHAVENNYEYLFFYLRKIEKEIERLGSGSTFKAINKNQLQSIKIALPSFLEQHKIAHILSKIQQAIEKQEQIIKTTQELKKALMQKLFTEGINDEPQKQTEIGLIPRSWEVIQLGSIVDFTTGKLNSNAASVNGQFPFFTCSQGDFWIDNYAFDQEAILLSGNNARAIYSVKYFNGKFNAYQRTYIITIKNTSEYDYIFLKNTLEYNLERLRFISIGTSTKYLTLGLLTNLPFIKPDLVEQKEIASILSSLMLKIEFHNNKKIELQDLFKTMLNQLMSGQLRVKDIDLSTIEE
jgi:type I restriction enzyme S subunit